LIGSILIDASSENLNSNPMVKEAAPVIVEIASIVGSSPRLAVGASRMGGYGN
jgi:hypothetical protein